MIQLESDFDRYSITGRDVLPAVDFTKNTLLLLQGTTNSGIRAIDIKMQTGEDQLTYVVKAEIHHSIACEAPAWKAAILAPVLPLGSSVGLEVVLCYD